VVAMMEDGWARMDGRKGGEWTEVWGIRSVRGPPRRPKHSIPYLSDARGWTCSVPSLALLTGCCPGKPSSPPGVRGPWKDWSPCFFEREYRTASKQECSDSGMVLPEREVLSRAKPSLVPQGRLRGAMPCACRAARSARE
jgi:hypothetical protein